VLLGLEIRKGEPPLSSAPRVTDATKGSSLRLRIHNPSSTRTSLVICCESFKKACLPRFPVEFNAATVVTESEWEQTPTAKLCEPLVHAPPHNVVVHGMRLQEACAEEQRHVWPHASLKRLSLPHTPRAKSHLRVPAAEDRERDVCH
jgi:hypothetical protein